MHTQAVIHELVWTLTAEPFARSIQAYGAGRVRARRDCRLERLARWIVSRRRARPDPTVLAR